MKKLLSLFAIAIFASSSFASEHINLRDEMMAMGQRLSFATRAQSAEEIQTNLNALIEAAERSKTIMPVKWQGDTSQFAGYQQGLQKVIDTAKEANNLAQQNKLDEAKEKIAELQELRRMYHKVYK